MAGIKVVILEDACASQPFERFSAEDAHAFALARFRYQFGQTMTTTHFREFTDGLPQAARSSSPDATRMGGI
jgi:nicotinamidase-related amidase